MTNPKTNSVDKSITIDCTAAEVYSFWSNFAKLPRVMPHITEVRSLDDGTFRWLENDGGPLPVEWKVEIVEDVPLRHLAWRGVRDGVVEFTGEVSICEAPAGRGTEVRYRNTYFPREGILGALAAKLRAPVVTARVTDALHRMKQLLETGEICTTEGQPAGRPMSWHKFAPQIGGQRNL